MTTLKVCVACFRGLWRLVLALPGDQKQAPLSWWAEHLRGSHVLGSITAGNMLTVVYICVCIVICVAECVRNEGVGGTTVLTCTINNTLPTGGNWEYTFPAVGGNTPGDYVANVTLVQPDDNPANDKDDAPIQLVAPAPIIDVAVNITALPSSGDVGSPFNYTVEM